MMAVPREGKRSSASRYLVVSVHLVSVLTPELHSIRSRLTVHTINPFVDAGRLDLFVRQTRQQSGFYAVDQHGAATGPLGQFCRGTALMKLDGALIFPGASELTAFGIGGQEPERNTESIVS